MQIIILPTLFEEKLNTNTQEKGIVYSSLANFGKWFESSGTPVFFRDYTDHGPRHITSVLATSAALIPRDAISVLTAADVTIFTIATLLHDSALHLAEPGFKEIIYGDASKNILKEFDSVLWPQLWEEFLFEARRWDDHKLVDVFGEEFVKMGQTISNPFDRWGNLLDSDKKLIGEFIRRYHPRLAHEFAVFGVPGVTSSAITLSADLKEDWRDLAGIVARSHGLPLRSCQDYIAKKYHLRDYQGIHAIYLMALIRLADYLQVDSSRAPDIVFRYRILPSRISALEWRAHNAVTNITPEHEDPESVQIDAAPQDVETYLRLRGWFDGIQGELDLSWAVLGEVYGRYPNLKNLGLLWRRIRSNLDDRSSFASRVPYLPRRIRLEVARSEMLSLLIRPLYGDDPSYGVRELMQNAVDAVREREYFQEKHTEYTNVELREQEADVVIWLSDFDEKKEIAWLEVSDKGIGMNEKVLTDYFLTAGSSYRHSEQWQRTFERSDLPADKTKPRSQILRSGRFGVGALAAFLLGEVIEVETRHISSSEGYRFKMNLTQEAVQVERVDNLPVGTRICVEVSKDAFEKLSKGNVTVTKPAFWDWYVLNKPSVLRLIGSERKILSNQATQNYNEWRTIETRVPLTITWRWPKYNSEYDNTTPRFACNGIFVSNSAKLPQINTNHCNSRRYKVQTPCLNIIDPDGIFPLGLTRKEILIDDYGFESEIAESVIKDFFAKILYAFPEEFAPQKILSVLGEHPFLGSNNSSPQLSCLFSKVGFCLPFSRSFSSLSSPVKHIIWVRSHEIFQLIPSCSYWDCVVLGDGPLLNIKEQWIERFEDILAILKFDSIRCTLPASADFRGRFPNNHKYYHHESKRWEVPKLLNSHEKHFKWKEKDSEKEMLWLIESINMLPSKFPFEKVLTVAKQEGFVDFVAECVFLEPWKQELSSDIIGKWWNHFFGDEWLPWKKEERKAKFPEAYEELSAYLKFYE